MPPRLPLPLPRLPHPHITRPLTTAPSLLRITNLPAPHTGTIRILSLSSPHNRNAISLRLLSELSSEITLIRNAGDAGPLAPGGVRALVLASEVEGVFCAGADLKERRGMAQTDVLAFLTNLRRTLRDISSLPIPSITALSSLALGGGFELALSTTFRVFAPTAVLGLPETRLGIIPGAGGTWRLRNLVGEARAMEMVLTGRRVSGREAGEWGLGRVVEVGDVAGKVEVGREVLEGAVVMAREVCEGGPGAVGCGLRAVRGGCEEAENRDYEICLRSEERVEALRAFAEKRKPDFGRVRVGGDI